MLRTELSATQNYPETRFLGVNSNGRLNLDEILASSVHKSVPWQSSPNYLIDVNAVFLMQVRKLGDFHGAFGRSILANAPPTAKLRRS